MRSALHDLFRVTTSFKPGTEDARERRWEMKGRPWGTILIAKFRWPSRERRSRLEILVAEVWLLITLEILSIFSLESEVWNLTESRRIPRNSREVAGPSVFSDAIGMTSSEKTL